MADQLRDLVLRLSADSKQLTAELRKVESGNSRTTKRIESEWKAAASTISGAFSKALNFAGVGGLAGGLAGGGAILGLNALASDAQDSASAIDDLSNRLGISRTAIQEYQFAARAAGIEQGAFEGALQKFGKAVGEAALGTGKARTSLAALGVSVRDTSGEARAIEAVFEDVVRALAEVENASTRTALAQRIFGQSGAAVAALSLEFEKQIGKARDLGIAMEDGVVVSLAEAQDASETLDAQLNQRLSESLSIVSAVAVGLKADLVELVEEMLEGAEAAGLLAEAMNFVPPSLLFDLDKLDERIDETARKLEAASAEMREFAESSTGTVPGFAELGLKTFLKEIEKLQRELEALEAQRDRLREVDKVKASGGGDGLDESSLDSSASKAAASAAAKEAAAATRELEAAQQRLNSVIEASFTPAERLVATMDQLALDFREGKISAEQFAQGQEAIGRQFDVLDQKIESSALKELDQILQASLTPAEKLIEQIDRMGQLYAEGSISAEQFGQAQDALEKQLAGIQTEDAQKQLTDLEQVGRGAFEGLTGAVADFVTTGKLDLASFTQSFVSELTQLGIKFGLGTAFPALKPLLGLADGGPAAAGRPYIVGERGPELFVPRSAGFVVPNVSTRGASAAVVAAASPAPVVVNIHNSTRSDVQAQERIGPGGQREIEILVTDVIARDIGRGGPVGRAIDGRLGMRPRGV